jgi:hypothetical protein
MATTYFRENRIETGPNNTLYFYPEFDQILNAVDMLELLEVLKQSAEVVPFRMIFVLNKHKIYLTKEARDLYKTNEESKHLFIAQAAVFNSITTQILIDLLLKVYPPPYPLKPFRTLDAAEAWIANQR